MGNDVSSSYSISKSIKKGSSSKKHKESPSAPVSEKNMSETKKAAAEKAVLGVSAIVDKLTFVASADQANSNTTMKEPDRTETVPLEHDDEPMPQSTTTAAAPPSQTTTNTKKYEMEQSATSFGPTTKKKPEIIRNSTPVQITDALGDVREKYHINLKEIGHGHYGVVRKCMNRNTQEWYAIKSIRKSKVGKIEVLKREIEILKEVDHPYIINLVDVYEDSKYIHLITELCTGGELFDRIIAKTQSDEGHFSERDAANLIWCILDAICYCHDVKQIVHRDLKPENFLFLTEADDSPVKIIDFGLSTHDDANFGVMKTKVGTPYYVAPEVLNREYTKSCDIWSIGVITYILLCGYPPFYGDSDYQIFESVRTGKFDFPSPDWDTISDDAKDFICMLLQMVPSRRLKAAEALQHKWITEKSTYSKQPVTHKSGKSLTFTKYINMKKLKKAALGYIATHLTESEVGSLGDIFHNLDSKNSGYITLKQLDDALKNGNFSTQLREELSQLREDLQLNNEETLNWKDFLAATMDKNIVLKEDKVREAFDYFRRSSTTHIRESDLVEIFGGEQQAREILDNVDMDGDGCISYEEFKKMLADTLADDNFDS